MKLQKILTLVVALMLVFSLCGCGAKANSDAKALTANQAGESNGSASSVDGLAKSGETAQTAAPANQKLIRTINLDAQTQDMDTLLTQVDQRIGELGGYVESRNIYNGTNQSGTTRTASLTIRIPAEKLD